MAYHLIVKQSGVSWPFCGRVPTVHAAGRTHAYRADQNYPSNGVTCKWCLKKLGVRRVTAVAPAEAKAAWSSLGFGGYVLDLGGISCRVTPSGDAYMARAGDVRLSETFENVKEAQRAAERAMRRLLTQALAKLP